MKQFDWRAAALALLATVGSILGGTAALLALLFALVWIVERTPAFVNDAMEWTGKGIIVLMGVLAMCGMWAKFYARFERPNRSLNPVAAKDDDRE